MREMRSKSVWRDIWRCMHVCCSVCYGREMVKEMPVCMVLQLALLCVWGGACGYSGMNIHLSHNTNKHIDPPLLYTVHYKKKRKKKQLALHLLRLARLKVVNGYWYWGESRLSIESVLRLFVQKENGIMYWLHREPRPLPSEMYSQCK